jgi:predicted DNA-binding transcriptional regulator YafY
MGTYGSLRRYYLILEKLRQGKTASFKSIHKHLEANDVDISPRTLQRDVAQIRADFSIDILYNKEVDGYYIDETTSFNLPGFYHFLELTLTSEILEEHLKKKKDLLRYIQFESLESFKGHENLKLIMQAILLKRWVVFAYTKYVEENTKHHEIIPCLLKRYQNRWYVIGKLNSGRSVTFGLDRMASLKIMSKTFREEEVEIPESLNSVVGLDYSGKPTRVVLAVTPLQAKYLKSLPLHASQMVISENKKETIFQYELIPNFELMQAILRLGDQVRVLEPEILMYDILTVAKKIVKNYE